MELAQYVVVFGHCTLALDDLDKHSGLIVRMGCDGLAFWWECSVPLTELRHHTTSSSQTHRQGVTSHSNKSCTCDEPRLQDCRLHCCTKGHCFVWVDGPVGPPCHCVATSGPRPNLNLFPLGTFT